ncbi:DUF3307 domain-containing protein [Echinicola jeungdonensis]|uniref:DUF3307 domain-containing protein n=1 Tax=Echinicola jeungdonensis TaxID=709343 RepID=A0ABV5J6D7_9BACT|nr:DUF3307 domain-containing protein [Echinicola jeungdonensis]MDN3670643.1 DUF3307 domain-containing protein [Echinicola jeungdonensis]
MHLSGLLTLQLIAHLMADFFFQTDRLAKEKNQLGFQCPFLKWHALIVFLLSWILSFQLTFAGGALIIAITHFLMDGFKKYLNQSKLFGKYAFFIDQGFHFLVIILVVFFFGRYFEIQSILPLRLPIKGLLIILAFLICLKPANIFIKEVFRAFEIPVPDNDDLPNAGKLIGVLERVLVLTFILLGQFQAVGFLIAAKSILRYKNDDTLKTEYVLIGTMLSFGIALLAAVLLSLERLVGLYFV